MHLCQASDSKPEQPSKPEPLARSAPVSDDKVESKDEEEKSSSKRSAPAPAPAPTPVAVNDNSIASERGKSRGGTRDGKPSQSNSSVSGISGIPNRPSNLDAEIEKCDGSYEATKELLGSVITRPKLTDKLLSKPPFRFLHDIVMEVQRTTGFANDLFGPDEIDSNNVKEKSQKLMFLEKIVKLVGVQLNTIVEARPAKIVSGLEPQTTNVLLQLLGVAARLMPDSTNAVRIVLDRLADGEDGGGGAESKADPPAPAPIPAPAPAPAAVAAPPPSTKESSEEKVKTERAKPKQVTPC